MISHKPWLQTAAPAIAEDKQGRELLEGGLAWKHLRIKGLHIIIGTIYFDHTTGLTGVNLNKMRNVRHLSNNGRIPIF